MRKAIIVLLLVVAFGAAWVLVPATSETPKSQNSLYNLSDYRKKENPMSDSGTSEYAVLAGGCFWCVEAVYERINGIKSAVSGYTGGTVPNPSYRQVTTGTTGHAEAVRIEYDPEIISYEEILKIFWISHDPTTLNRQGADAGTQYRSAIFYADAAQKEAAEKSLAEAQPDFNGKIVTEVSPLEDFYVAEDYHQDYFELNPNAGYCQFVIAPKLQKLGLSGDTF